MNWLALVAGALVPMVLGFIWYSKALFGNVWMKSIGKTEEDLKGGNMAVILGLSFLLSAVLAYFVSQQLGIHDYINGLNGEGAYPHSFGHGAFHGLFLGLMVAAPIIITNSLFEQRNWTNILINAAYWVLTVAMMAGVMSLFI